MKKRLLLPLVLMLFLCGFLQSQPCDFPFPPGSIFDEDIPVFCDGIDGYCSILPPQYTSMELLGCPANEFGLHNPQLIRFIAGSTFIRLRISPVYCSGNAGGFGIQAAIYPLGHPLYDPSWPSVVNCGTGMFPPEDIILEAYNYEIGKPYYLLVDGWAGDVCEYVITVEAGSTVALPLDDVESSVSGPDEVCPGDIVTLSASAPGACIFNWSITGGVEVGGNGYNSVAVEVTNAGNFGVCVSATNYCYESEEDCFFFPEGTPEVILDTLIYAEICAGENYYFYGQTLTEAGIYQDSLQENCEISLFNLNLEVIEVSPTEVSESICTTDCYEWNGMELCASGSYEAILTSFQGCDSVVTLELELLEGVETSISGVFCSGGGYEWNGTIYDMPGVYEQIFSLPNGCDSTVVLTLSEHPGITQQFNWEICSGHIVQFEGVQYGSSGAYVHTYSDVNGCDSTLILILTVLPPPSLTLEDTICEGESVTVGNLMFYETGDYTINLLDDIECDSIVYLNLTVLPNSTVLIDTSLIAGDVYNDIPVYQDTIIVEIYEAANGCDSIVITNITVTTTSLTEQLQGNDINLFPNPATKQTHLSFTLEEAMFVQISIYDLSGREVFIPEKGSMLLPGQYQYTIDVASLPPGMYVLSIGNSVERAIRKLIVAYN